PRRPARPPRHRPRPPRHRRLLERGVTMPFGTSLVTAALSGLLVSLAFPGYGIWPLSIPGTSLLLWALHGRTVRESIWVGLVGGAFYWGPLIDWLTVYLGPVPWIALAGVMTLYFAAGAVLISLAWGWI